MIRFICFSSLIVLTACAPTMGRYGTANMNDGRGRYVRPDYMNPEPMQSLSPVDTCNSLLYQALIGRHEGAIYIPGLPGRKRILKPAYDEGFNYQRSDDFYSEPALIEVREYIAGQSPYAPSISTVSNRLDLGPVQADRLTLELDGQGYVRAVRCE